MYLLHHDYTLIENNFLNFLTNYSGLEIRVYCCDILEMVSRELFKIQSMELIFFLFTI